MNEKQSFLIGRFKSLGYALKGAKHLITTEHSIISQSFIGFLVILCGFYFQITKMEWIMQIFAIGLVLTAEGLNTAIEKMCDFVHPDFHVKIGKIKDMAAGSVTFAVFTAVTIAVIIYYPYINETFFTSTR